MIVDEDNDACDFGVGGHTTRALPADAPDAFADDDASPHETAINQLAALGLTDGTTATTYSPEKPVTRAQMAKFLVET